jgi:hypothetical protein
MAGRRRDPDLIPRIRSMVFRAGRPAPAAIPASGSRRSTIKASSAWWRADIDPVVRAGLREPPVFIKHSSAGADKA